LEHQLQQRLALGSIFKQALALQQAPARHPAFSVPQPSWLVLRQEPARLRVFCGQLLQVLDQRREHV
jgi:hypothetical protein